MAATSTIDAARVRQLEAELKYVRIHSRALEIAILGSFHLSGYEWAYTKAMRENAEQELREAESAIAGADLSEEAILAATADASSRHGSAQARDVAINVLPAIAPPDAPGRQLLIARVGAAMRELVETGKLVRVSAPHGRKTSRYALAEGGSQLNGADRHNARAQGPRAERKETP